MNQTFVKKEYKYGFSSDIKSDILEKGLSKEIIKKISKIRKEPKYILDFRLEALTGHYNYAQAPDGTKYVTGFSVYETSGWSETQTITVGESQDSSTEPTIPTSPTPLPSEEPQSTEQTVILGLAIAVAVITVGLGLLLYLIKRE